jgi:hypothetical protein
MEKRAISWREFKQWCRYHSDQGSIGGYCTHGLRAPLNPCRVGDCPIWKRLPQLAKDSDLNPNPGD